MKIKVIEKSSRCRDRLELEFAPGIVFSADPACADYDWLVVYDEMKRVEDLRCPRERTILATCEPVSIKHYSRAYIRQFGHLLTNRPDVDGHPHYHLGRGYYKWFCDRTYQEAGSLVLPPKTKLISAVCSSKQMKHTKHHARFQLISKLAEAIPEFEWYGHGVRSFGKKHEVMDPYRYHVVVENHIAPHHWTEKLTDAFLCECLPFYAGAPDLADDFPADSFIPIPIDDPAEAIRVIKESIANGEYEKRRSAVLEAKRLVLSKYNFWSQVVALIESAADQSSSVPDRAVRARILPRKSMRWHSPSAFWDDLKSHLFGALHNKE